MTQNDFYIAIQGIMTEAYESWGNIDQVYDYAVDAVEEWMGEMSPPEDEE